MRTITRTLTAAALACTALLAGAGAAGAEPSATGVEATDDPLPHNLGIDKIPPDEVEHGPVFSPYGTDGIVCYSYYGGRFGHGCFQRGSDGSWVKMVGYDWFVVYPVWEDPKAMLNALPPQIRDQAEALLDR
ncbi:hypothetical protein [Corynebacterium sp.]|uniref:hypothetical protein n=1 Tax=Corynebacterium sp. TaxID=1720 RepID=UPI0026DB625B|nr:hypothetical protein [Corynebacterium sp.]MDO4610538.1 hypothetical protein [Corynebacterium sp.]